MHELEFTSASFHRIAVLEARRGRPDPGRQFSAVSSIMSKLKDVRIERQIACGGLWKTDRPLANEKYASFRQRIFDLQQDKRRALEHALEGLSAELSSELAKGQFSWGLKLGPKLKTRQTYIVSGDAKVYFTRKQLELNLKNTHGIKAPNRHQLVAQFRDSLEGQLPAHVIRTDIAEFYESICHSKLRTLLGRGGLSETSRLLIDQLLSEWFALTGRKVGLPTGVGIAAYLAEIYARSLDARIATESQIRFFGRYVDDIVVVVASEEACIHVATVVQSVLGDAGLTENLSKREIHKPVTGKQNLLGPINFLGYSLSKTAGHVSVSLEERVFKRYESRIKLAFARWDRLSSPKSGHEGLLLDRIKFLTGNTKLVNSKGRAVTGIYFNYPAMTEMDQLSKLDKQLRNQLANSRLPKTLKTRLKAQSFVAGFTGRVFHSFSQDRLKRLVVVWREA